MKCDTTTLRHLFSKNVKARRHKLGWSQEALAGASGLHRTYIGSVERCERNISIDNIQRIAEALGVSPNELISETE